MHSFLCMRQIRVTFNIDILAFHEPGVPKQLQWYIAAAKAKKRVHKSLEKVEILDQIGKKSNKATVTVWTVWSWNFHYLKHIVYCASTNNYNIYRMHAVITIFVI